MRGQRILLVEDKEPIIRANERMLIRRGYEVICALSLAQAQSAVEAQMPDLIVLDIMLADGSGLDFMEALRRYSRIPVLLLTGLNQAEDIVRGLSQGADDYLSKPYDFGVLLARVEALLRRAQTVPERLFFDRLSLDMMADVATVGGADLLLTHKEFALLLIFVQNKEQFISGQYLYEKAWKASLPGDSNALKTTINRLRQKLEGSGCKIVWSRGEGYSLERE